MLFIPQQAKSEVILIAAYVCFPCKMTHICSQGIFTNYLISRARICLCVVSLGARKIMFESRHEKTSKTQTDPLRKPEIPGINSRVIIKSRHRRSNVPMHTLIYIPWVLSAYIDSAHLRQFSQSVNSRSHLMGGGTLYLDACIFKLLIFF